jgi:predicted nucleic acid-binding protein
MSRIVLLDAGPLGVLTTPRQTPAVLACRQWLNSLLAQGVFVHVTEIADYEVRRELLRARKARGLRRLDQLNIDLGYVPLTTAAVRQAAIFWAQLRQQGRPTAPDVALDGDVILAAQAALLIGAGHSVVVATTNVGHLSRLVPAELWQNITS